MSAAFFVWLGRAILAALLVLLVGLGFAFTALPFLMCGGIVGGFIAVTILWLDETTRDLKDSQKNKGRL